MPTAPVDRLSANYYLAPAGTGVEQFMRWAKKAGASGVGLTIAALSEHPPTNSRKWQRITVCSSRR